MSERLSAERLAELRREAEAIIANPISSAIEYIDAHDLLVVLRELDAVTRERDECIARQGQLTEKWMADVTTLTRERDEARKDSEERGAMLFDEQVARQRAERARDEALEIAKQWKSAYEHAVRWPES